MKIYMDWKKFEDDISEFIEYLNDNDFNDNNTVIIALKRGGFTTAVTLSNRLNIPISTVTFQTRDGDDVAPIFLEPDLLKDKTKFIIPDDIYDSGITYDTVLAQLESEYNIKNEQVVGLFHYASKNIYKSNHTNFRVMTPNNNQWVVMPWE